MSNSLAIAATTLTLHHLLLTRIPALDPELADLEVTAQPPDLARKGITKSQLNLFLYQTVVNAAWRNHDMPRQLRPGETGQPPLALNLHYLLTAYGRGDSDNDALSHRVLGGAMSVLHDHPVLGRQEIDLALASSELADQFERLRVTPLPVGVDELSKLWTIFQSQYRISAAYEVTVVLIDSGTPIRAPLPVLTRGVGASAGPAPVLREIQPPHSQQAARLGEDIVILGQQLSSANAVLVFKSPRQDTPIQLPLLAGGTSDSIGAHLPDLPDDSQAYTRWVPGGYTCALVLQPPGQPALASTPVAFALAPRITVSPNHAAPGTVALTLTCAPRLVDGQRVLLIFGDRPVEPSSITTPADIAQPSTLTFSVPDVANGNYLVRLRVDGVDSIPVQYSGTPPVPAFDHSQRVSVP
jgi:hypothetical protein